MPQNVNKALDYLYKYWLKIIALILFSWTASSYFIEQKLGHIKIDLLFFLKKWSEVL